MKPLGAILCIVLCCGPAARAEEPPSKEGQVRLAEFDYLWQTARDWCDPGMLEAKGVDWDAVRATLRPRVAAAKSETDFLRLCSEALAGLRDTHAYLQPADEGVDLHGDVYAGMFHPGVTFAECVGKRVAVHTVLPGSPADKAGLKRGMVVSRVDGKEAFSLAEARAREKWEREQGDSSSRCIRHAAFWQLAFGEEGTKVQIEAKGKRYTLKREMPFGGLYLICRLQDGEIMARCEVDGECFTTTLDRRYGYLCINKFNAGDPQAALNRFLTSKEIRGVVIDVRDNPGGGAGEPWKLADYDKPVVVIACEATTSAAEHFLTWFGFGEANPSGHPNLMIVGRTTHGASGSKSLSTVPSRRFSFWFTYAGGKGLINAGPNGEVEFHGVSPDEEVLFDPVDLARGEDTMIKRAVRLLDEKLSKKGAWPSHRIFPRERYEPVAIMNMSPKQPPVGPKGR